MKLGTFYFEDNLDDDFYGTILSNIVDKFMYRDISSQIVSSLISYLRMELMKYIKKTYKKNVRIIVLLHSSDEKLIQSTTFLDCEIKVVLNKNKIIKIILGDEILLSDYVYQIIDEINTFLTQKNKLQSIDYMKYNMKELAELCKIELISKLGEDNVLNLLKEKHYSELSSVSPIFNDYFQCFLNGRKKLFNFFIEKMMKGV